jgi:DNA-directed RNA polymerase specialized sigma24 family protein
MRSKAGGTLQIALPEEPKIILNAELARVFEDHHAFVFRAAYRVTGNAADAEDVLQTIFLRLCNGATLRR